MISLFWIVVHVTVFSGADTALTKAWVPLELVFAKYILLPQKTSANFRAPFIGISVISFCLAVPIKAAALLFYRVWKSLSWNYIKKSPSSNNNFVTVIYFGNWACRGFLFHIANCCSAVYSVCISKTKCWEMVCFIFIFGGYDNCISWFSCFNVDKRYLTISLNNF